MECDPVCDVHWYRNGERMNTDNDTDSRFLISTYNKAPQPDMYEQNVFL